MKWPVSHLPPTTRLDRRDEERRGVVDGAYWLREPGPNCEVVIAYQGVIAPEAIGSGLGKQLYDWALEQARLADAVSLHILSDPNARGFYTAMGARFVEDRPSELIPDRVLPWLEHRLA